MYCRKCGEKNINDAVYCKKCGQRLKCNNRSAKKYYVIISLVALMVVVGLGMALKFNIFQNKTNRVQLTEKLYYTRPDEKEIACDVSSGKRYVKDELVFEATAEAEFTDIERVVAELDGKINGYIGETNTYQITFNKELKYDELLNKEKILQSSQYIDKVSLNTVYTCTSYANYPNDKEWLGEWSEMPGGQNWGLEAIQAPEAWETLNNMIGMEAVNVGVLEVGGIETEHEDLKDSFKRQPLCNMNDDLEHGTQVAGIIGAGYNNGIGITGVVPKVNIDAVSYNKGKQYLENGHYTDVSIMMFKVACTYLIATCETPVINASLGFALSSFAASRGNKNAQGELKDFNDNIGQFLNILIDKGYDFLICKASGNGNEKYNENRIYQYLKADEDDKNAPFGYISANDKKSIKKYKSYKDFKERIEYGDVDAQYDVFAGIAQEEVKDRIIVVGSVSQGISTNISEFSNCGTRLDVVAPGDDIYSTTSGNKYMKKGGWGTSYSAPYVSGIAALIYAVNPALSGKDVKKIICNSATGEYWGYLRDEQYKYRMVNALNAVKSAKETVADTNNSTEEKQDKSKLEEGVYIYRNGEYVSMLEVLEAGNGKKQCNLMFWHRYGESSSDEDFFFEWEEGKEQYVVFANRAHKDAQITMVCKGDSVEIRVVIPGLEYTWDGSGDLVNQEYVKTDERLY